MPPPEPEPRRPEPAFGPDEEGELPLEPDAIPEDDAAAWVHLDRKLLED